MGFLCFTLPVVIMGLVGYARCAAIAGDKAEQCRILRGLRVPASRIVVDEPLTGSAPRPGLQQAVDMLAPGSTLVTPSLARLARSLADACSIIERLAQRRACLSVGGLLHDPANGSLLSDLALFVQFETELKRLQTREGMAVARSQGRPPGQVSKLSAQQRAELVQLHADGYPVTALAERFGISRPTVYRVLHRAAEHTS